MTAPDEAGRFSSWRPLTAEALALPLDAPAVVQVKVVGELVAYPRGQSAMLWYGVVAPDALEATVLAVAAGSPEGELAWRILTTPSPSADLARVLDAFVARFGAAPRLNALDRERGPA